MKKYKQGVYDSLRLVKKILDRHHLRVGGNLCIPLCIACSIEADLANVDLATVKKITENDCEITKRIKL